MAITTISMPADVDTQRCCTGITLTICTTVICTSHPAACNTNTPSKSASRIPTAAPRTIPDVTTALIDTEKDVDTNQSHTATITISFTMITSITRMMTTATTMAL